MSTISAEILNLPEFALCGFRVSRNQETYCWSFLGLGFLVSLQHHRLSFSRIALCKEDAFVNEGQLHSCTSGLQEMGVAIEVTQPSRVVDIAGSPPASLSSPQQQLFKDAVSVEFSPCVRSGVWFDIGARQNMEDEHVLIDDLVDYLGPQIMKTASGSFYGVFDGHDGRNAAQFVKDKLLKFIVSDDAFPSAVEEAVQHAFLQTDAAFAEACSLNQCLSSGTTAITVLVLGREIFVANAGDCRAVLCRKGKAIEMSRDHKPDEEKSRIEALGGFIYDGYLNGQLSVARAIGNWHIEGLKGENCPLSAEPEVKRALLTEDDEFMIIGCDGFWDVFSNENAVAFARRKLQQHNDPGQCSHELVDEALRRNTSDNLTVVVVCFQKHPPPRLFQRFLVRRQLYADSKRKEGSH